MSRAQSPSREQTLNLNLLAEQLLKLSDAVQTLKDRMDNFQTNPSGSQPFRERVPEATSATFGPEDPGTLIKTYDKAMHLVPEFDGLNVESFIGHIQVAVKRLAIDQHELLLCGIIAQKLTGRTKGTVRIDATPSFPQFFEKLRYLYGKAKNLSALEVQRDTCIQRYNENIDEFISRFLRIHDEIITTINSQNTGVMTICIQEELCQRKSIEIFRRNVKSEIGDHLYSFELDTLNQVFSKARAFEGELQLRKLRTQRNETLRKPLINKPRFQDKECDYCKKRGHEEKECRIKAFHQDKECDYCKRRGHEEKECRTKAFHQQRGQQNFRERHTFNRPPDQASRPSHAIDRDPEQHNSERPTKDLAALMSEHPELH